MNNIQIVRILLIVIFQTACSLSTLEETKNICPIVLDASYNTDSRGVLLSWDTKWEFQMFKIIKSVKNYDVHSIVYIYDVLDGPFLDQKTITGKEYWYQIQAFSLSGRLIGQSAHTKGKRAYLPKEKIVPPNQEKASQEVFYDKIELYWGGGRDNIYRIYRKSSLVPYQMIAETTNTFYSDKAVQSGIIYDYKISVVYMECGVVQELFSCNEFQGSTFLGISDLHASQNLVGQIEISWNKNPNVLFYQIFRSKELYQNYDLIVSFHQDSSYIDIFNNSEKKIAKSKSRSTHYYYKITGFLDLNQPSFWSYPIKGSFFKH